MNKTYTLNWKRYCDKYRVSHGSFAKAYAMFRLGVRTSVMRGWLGDDGRRRADLMGAFGTFHDWLVAKHGHVGVPSRIGTMFAPDDYVTKNVQTRASLARVTIEQAIKRLGEPNEYEQI